MSPDSTILSCLVSCCIPFWRQPKSAINWTSLQWFSYHAYSLTSVVYGYVHVILAEGPHMLNRIEESAVTVRKRQDLLVLAVVVRHPVYIYQYPEIKKSTCLFWPFHAVHIARIRGLDLMFSLLVSMSWATCGYWSLAFIKLLKNRLASIASDTL